MEQIEQTKKQLSPAKQKLNILFATLAGLGVGGVLGIIGMLPAMAWTKHSLNKKASMRFRMRRY